MGELTPQFIKGLSKLDAGMRGQRRIEDRSPRPGQYANGEPRPSPYVALVRELNALASRKPTERQVNDILGRYRAAGVDLPADERRKIVYQLTH